MYDAIPTESAALGVMAEAVASASPSVPSTRRRAETSSAPVPVPSAADRIQRLAYLISALAGAVAVSPALLEASWPLLASLTR
jgi:ribosomal protein S7